MSFTNALVSLYLIWIFSLAVVMLKEIDLKLSIKNILLVIGPSFIPLILGGLVVEVILLTILNFLIGKSVLITRTNN